MEKNDTMPDIMKRKANGRPKKARTLDNHYRSNDVEYELIARTAHKKNLTIAEYTRSRMIPPNPEAQLETLRAEQRKARIPDDWFTHPKLKKASE